jgi:PAS domain S-box-containing protein
MAAKKTYQELEKDIKRLEREKALYLVDIEKYQSLVNNLFSGIFQETLGGKYIEVNNTMAKLLGYSNSNEIIKNIKDIADQVYTDPKERKRLVKKAVENNGIIQHEALFRRKDNTVFPVNISMKVMRNKQGKPLYITGMIEDISERKKADESLLQERNQLRTLIDNIPDYIYLKDAKGEFIVANNAFAKLVKADSPDQLIGSSKLNIKDQEFAVNFLKNDKETLDTGQPLINNEERGYVEHEGRTIYAYTSKIPLKDRNGVVTGLIGIGRHITDLKMAEQQIIENQSNLTAVIESTKSSLWSIDRNYTITTVNTYFKKLFKLLFRKEIDVGDNILMVLPDKERLKWKNIYQRAFKGDQWIMEDTFVRRGINMFFEYSVNPIVDKNGYISGVTVFSTNITNRKAVEEAIRESEERFRQLAENTNVVFILSNRKNILYANPAFERVYGRKVEELIKNPSILEHSIHPEDKENYLKNNKNKFSNKQIQDEQYQIVQPGGKIRKVWAKNFPIYNNKGKIYRYVSVINDITEQKELELTILKTKTQQKAILDNIPHLAWLKDNEGRYISVNEPFALHYNLDASEIIGKTDFDLNLEELAKKYTENDNDVKSSGKRQLIEAVEETPEGQRWIETFKTPIFNQQGKLIGITGISRDITDRKKMEETIKENEEYFRALLQHSSDAISILDEKGKIIFENSPRNKIFDFSIDELINKPIFDIVHPDDIEHFKEFFGDVLKNPQRQIKREYRCLHKNKKWIYVESIFSNQLSNPFIKGIVVNSRDISERKMGELKERVYHDNLIFLSNSALDLLGISSKDDIYRYISEKLYNFLESAIVIVTSCNEKEGKLCIEYISRYKDNKNKVVNILGENPIGMILPINNSISNINNAGAVITLKDEFLESNLNKIDLAKWFEIKEILKVHKVYNITLARHNKLLGNITILTLNKSIIKFKHIIETFVHQISVALHRSQLEYELITAKEKAEESDKLKTAFLANMSHEIRTPMNGILGFAEMLNDDELDQEDRKKYLEIINNNGKMLISLIDDIIDFAKIEAGQIKIVQNDFSLNSLLKQVHSSFLSENLKKEKSKVNLKMIRAFNDDECYIKSDPNRLRQVLNNLISNAFKFTSEGYIEFGYKVKHKKTLKFYVKDTGIGIPEKKLGEIFSRFIQADNSPTRKYGGSGLGLAISKGIVDLLGGRMWATSKESEGSAFYFEIPYIKAEKVIEVERKKKARTDYVWDGKVFLIAEDDKFSFKFLEGFLRQTKAIILHAEDGKEAVELCLKNKDIDLVLMDIQMPEMNGLEATKEIKKFNRDMPIIAQTANAITEERQKCIKAGCDDFITKPVNITELYSLIDRYLTSKH